MNVNGCDYNISFFTMENFSFLSLWLPWPGGGGGGGGWG